MNKTYKIQKHYWGLDLHGIAGKEVTIEELQELFSDDICTLFCRYLPDGYRFFDAPMLEESIEFEDCAAGINDILKQIRLKPRKDLC